MTKVQKTPIKYCPHRQLFHLLQLFHVFVPPKMEPVEEGGLEFLIILRASLYPDSISAQIFCRWLASVWAIKLVASALGQACQAISAYH